MSIKEAARLAARSAYKSWTLDWLYPDRYRRAAARRPVDPKKIVFLEVRQSTLSDSFTLLWKALEKKGDRHLKAVCLQEGMTDRARVRENCLRAAEEAADAAWILVNDSCYFLSSLPLRPQTRVIQLWHACGAFKKFGYSLADKRFGATVRELDRFPVHRNFTYVTVSGPEVSWAYAQAFRMDKERILPTGISRTDVFFDPGRRRAARQRLEECLRQKTAGAARRPGKRILLYAPTFRGRVADAVSPSVLDFGRMSRALGEDWVFLCKHHPFVKKPPAIPAEWAGHTFDVTRELAIEDLLMCADVCVSDYSSLVFEYSLFERPMAFLAYDLEDYFDWRGFYYPYEELAPGPVVRDTGQLVDYLKSLPDGFDRGRVHAFREKFMSCCDGHATERILGLMEGQGN